MYPRCPHCGASRDGMPDTQPCWRCKRLPTPRFTATTEPTVVTALDNQSLIPPWLWVTGTLGILLFCGIILGTVWLFLTAEDEEAPEAPAGSGSVALVSPAIAMTTPPPLSTDSVASPFPTNTAVPTLTVVIGPFAETANAMQPTLTPSLIPSLLPTPSPAPTATPLTPTPLVCPGAPQTRLELNQQATVISQSTVRVRETPGLNGREISNATRGQTVTVIDGPMCQDGFVWWRIRLPDNQEGWIAEGNTTQYFLEPLVE